MPVGHTKTSQIMEFEHTWLLSSTGPKLFSLPQWSPKLSFSKMRYHVKEDSPIYYVENGKWLRLAVHAVSDRYHCVLLKDIKYPPKPLGTSRWGPQCLSTQFWNHVFNRWLWISSLWNFSFSFLLVFRCSEFKELENKIS